MTDIEKLKKQVCDMIDDWEGKQVIIHIALPANEICLTVEEKRKHKTLGESKHWGDD